MLKESVTEGIKATREEVQKSVDSDTKRLSDRLGDKLASMILEVATLEKQAERARSLVDQMEEEDKRVKTIETDINSRVNGLAANITQIAEELKANVQKIENKAHQTEQVITSLALTAAPSQGVDNTITRSSNVSTGALGFLAIRQVPTPLGKSSSEPSRPNYLLTFSAVDEGQPQEEARALLDSVGRVTYRLDERWFTPHDFPKTNRADNFQFSVTVWGRTTVKAKAEFVGKAPPICWSGLMDLEKEVKFGRSDCDW
jgi:hypothetical protein